MDTILNFIVENYIWFLAIAIVLILALVGYIADVKINRTEYFERKEKEALESLNNLEIANNVGLSSAINNNVNKISNEKNSPEILEVTSETPEKLDDSNQTQVQ